MALRNDPDTMNWLVAVIFLLVIGASVSCWELLKEIGNQHAAPDDTTARQ